MQSPTDSAGKKLSSRVTGMKFMQRSEEQKFIKQLDAERSAQAAQDKWGAASAGESAAHFGPGRPPARALVIETTDGCLFDDEPVASSSSLANATTAAGVPTAAARVARLTADQHAAALNGIARMRTGRRTYGGQNAALAATLADLTRTAVIGEGADDDELADSVFGQRTAKYKQQLEREQRGAGAGAGAGGDGGQQYKKRKSEGPGGESKKHKRHE